jgi:HK97 family phage portal protein
VYCAVRVISEAIAGLPLLLYRHTDAGKEEATTHPLYDLLRHNPNPDMTGVVFREVLQHHVLTWGNAFAEIERDGAGRPVALWPLLPNRVRVFRAESGEIVYQAWLYPQGETVILRAEDVFHVPGLSFDGIQGLGPIQLARQSLDLSRNAETFGASFFNNGARPSGMLKTPTRLSDNARENLRKSFGSAYAGAANAGSVPLLEEGLEFVPNSIPPEDAQFLQTRQFQVVEVARWFNISPVFLHDLGRATWGNLETLNTQFVQRTLMPWLLKWEAETRKKLLMPSEQARYYAEFNVDSLLRGDTLSRFQVYNTALQNGIYSINEVRAKENMNPIPGGDDHRVQLNLGPTQQPDQNTDAKGTEANNDAEDGQQEASNED